MKDLKKHITGMAFLVMCMVEVNHGNDIWAGIFLVFGAFYVLTSKNE